MNTTIFMTSLVISPPSWHETVRINVSVLSNHHSQHLHIAFGHRISLNCSSINQLWLHTKIQKYLSGEYPELTCITCSHINTLQQPASDFILMSFTAFQRTVSVLLCFWNRTEHHQRGSLRRETPDQRVTSFCSSLGLSWLHPGGGNQWNTQGASCLKIRLRRRDRHFQTLLWFAALWSAQFAPLPGLSVLPLFQFPV